MDVMAMDTCAECADLETCRLLARLAWNGCEHILGLI